MTDHLRFPAIVNNSNLLSIPSLLTQFVYEPHIAPKFEQWAEEFIAVREARRRQRTPTAPISNRRSSSSDSGSSDEKALPRLPGQRDSFSGSNDEMQEGIRLETLVAREVREWRTEVDRSQSLRRRTTASGQSHTEPSIDMVRIQEFKQNGSIPYHATSHYSRTPR